VKSRRVLLIEKENAIRELAQLCLEIAAGWEVLVANSGSEVIVLAETRQVDAILLDLDAYSVGCSAGIEVTAGLTPDRNDLTILQQLQQNPVTQHIPVILLTNTIHSHKLPQSIELGGIIAIAKPFDLLALAHQVAIALKWE
jgi:CheY-like chemotaxis protein